MIIKYTIYNFINQSQSKAVLINDFVYKYVVWNPQAKSSSSNKFQGLNSIEQRDPSTRQWRYLGKVKGGLFKDIKLIPFDRKVDVPHGVCFNCWEYDHSRQNCPLPDRSDHCRNCGRIGVKTNNCPRCSEAYLKYWNTKDNFDQKAQVNLQFAISINF